MQLFDFLNNIYLKINSNNVRFLKYKGIRKVKERPKIYIDDKIKLKYIST